MAGIIKCDQVQSDSNLAFNIAGSNVAFMNATSLQMVGSNVLLAGTNVITNGKVVSSGMPVGSVLQVVNATYATFSSTTSTTFVDSGLTISITPSSATSKILAIVSLSGVGKSGFNTSPKYQLVRGATAILGIDNGSGFTNSTAYNISSATANYLDSPATTSATTYKVQYGIDVSGGTAYLNYNQNNITTSTITLMEIAA